MSRFGISLPTPPTRGRGKTRAFVNPGRPNVQILILGATGFNGSAAAPPPLGRVCDPARKPVTAAGAFISENLTALKNFAEYVAPGELKSVEELKPGCGAIVRDGLKKVAAYRDKSGSLHLHSAACTHLGCHVHWNSLEVCWDCPCRGYRYGLCQRDTGNAI